MRGQKTEGYIRIADWFAPFYALAGIDPTDEKAAKAKLPPVDSLNMWPLIFRTKLNLAKSGHSNQFCNPN